MNLLQLHNCGHPARRYKDICHSGRGTSICFACEKSLRFRSPMNYLFPRGPSYTAWLTSPPFGLTGLLFIILTVQVRDRSVTGEGMKQILETSGVRVSMFSGSIDMCFSGDWPLTTLNSLKLQPPLIISRQLTRRLSWSSLSHTL